MYAKADVQWNTIKRIELTSDSTTILLHIKTETGTEEVYKCRSELPDYYHLRKLHPSDIIIPSGIVCGNKDLLI